MLEQIELIRRRVMLASSKAGLPKPARLVAVSKTQSVRKIDRLYQKGQRDFAENYLQEAVAKQASLPKDIIWHFIGPLQSNKTRAIAENFQWVQSIDRCRIAQRLDRHCQELGKHLNVCIQINISREESKSGVLPEDFKELYDCVRACQNLRLRGLMAIPSSSLHVHSASDLEKQFLAMQTLFHRIRDENTHLDTLSMGMSQDFERAIAHGSTMVRVGTALFGQRPENRSVEKDCFQKERV